MSRTFNATPAKRDAVPLILGLVGPSSSGKTFTALRLAKGIQSVTGGDIHLIDTENGRAKHYADDFEFKHVQFDPPFASLDYLSAMEQSVKAGAKVIIVDSMSHEHESVGGMVDYHAAELQRMAGDDYGKQQKMTMLAWQKPKAARRRLLQGITRLNAHVILCFRAKETSKPIAGGKVQPMGFMPIAGDEFVYECSLSMMFPPNSGGVPNWSPDMPGEKIAVKLPRQFGWMRDVRGPVTESAGAKLAEWAAGDTRAKPEPSKPSDRPNPATNPEPIARSLSDEATERAQSDPANLAAWWNSNGTKQRRAELYKTDREQAARLKEIVESVIAGN